MAGSNGNKQREIGDTGVEHRRLQAPTVVSLACMNLCVSEENVAHSIGNLLISNWGKRNEIYQKRKINSGFRWPHKAMLHLVACER